MSERYQEIRKKQTILKMREPWNQEAEAQMRDWSVSQIVYAFTRLNGMTVSREGVDALLAGALVPEASVGDYTYVQGVGDSLHYLYHLAGDSEDHADGRTPHLAGLAEFCRMWCYLEGYKDDVDCYDIWEEGTYVRKENPVLSALSHVPCHFNELGDALDALFSWLKDVMEKREELAVNPIAIAAEFHNRLLYLWPFAGHNEELARLGAESVLLTCGLPMVSWEMKEQTYYSSAAAYLQLAQKTPALLTEKPVMEEGIQPLYEILEEQVYQSICVAVQLTA